MASSARQNYHQDCEAAVNKQINLNLHASYVYLSMAYYFDRDDIALPGFHAFYRRQSERERRRAEKLLKFQNARGGRIVFNDIQKPMSDEWAGAAEALQAALELEKNLNKSLLDLHSVADKHGDKQMTSFIEDAFLDELVKTIKMISDMIANVKRVGPGLGIYQFDKTIEEKVSTVLSGKAVASSNESRSSDHDHSSGFTCPFGIH